MEYGYKKKIPASFEEALRKTREELPKEGFGVLTEIDVKATLKKKLSKKEDIDTHPLMIRTVIATQEAEQRFLMVESLSKVLNKNMSTVSRNIELRKIAFESDRREGNLSRSFISELREAEEGKIEWKTRNT